jgi:hypothetical protein
LAHPAGSGTVKDWLLGSKPQDKNELDFRVALENMSQPVSFSVQALMGGPGIVPGELAGAGAGPERGRAREPGIRV